jgi:hypothetical protein
MTSGGIREHVVDGQRPAGRHVRRPPVVDGLGRRVGVAAVDEHHPQRVRRTAGTSHGGQSRWLASGADSSSPLPHQQP